MVALRPPDYVYAPAAENASPMRKLSLWSGKNISVGTAKASRARRYLPRTARGTGCTYAREQHTARERAQRGHSGLQLHIPWMCGG